MFIDPPKMADSGKKWMRKIERVPRGPTHAFRAVLLPFRATRTGSWRPRELAVAGEIVWRGKAAKRPSQSAGGIRLPQLVEQVFEFHNLAGFGFGKVVFLG
jgi:hypothetical protein